MREIKAQFEAVYDHHYQMTGLIDTDGRLLMGNRTALELAGLEAKDVVGKLFWETPWWTHSAVEQQKLRDALDRALGGEMAHFESTHLDASGESHDIDFRVRPVFDENRNVIYLVPEGYDITTRKRAEVSLRRQAEFDAIIAGVLARFARAAGSEIDECIDVSLGEVARFLDVDNAYVLQLSEDRASYTATHNWVGPSTRDLILGDSTARLHCFADFEQRAVR